MKNKRIIFFIIPLLIISTAAATVEKNRYYYIKSVISGDEDKGYWDLPGGGRRYKNGDDLHLWAFDKGDDRKYMFTPAGNGWDYISPGNAASGLEFSGTLEAEYNTAENRSGLFVRDASPTDNSSRQFKVKDTGEGKFKIYINSGNKKRILCAESGSAKNGTPVIILDDNDTPACLWRFIEMKRAVKN